MVLGKRVAIFDWEWGQNSAPRDGQKRPCFKVHNNYFYGKKMVISMPPNTHTVHIRFSKF